MQPSVTAKNDHRPGRANKKAEGKAQFAKLVPLWLSNQFADIDTVHHCFQGLGVSCRERKYSHFHDR